MMMMTMSVEQSMEWLAGEAEVLRETLPQCRFVHHKSHMTWRARNRASAVVSRRLTTALWISQQIFSCRARSSAFRPTPNQEAFVPQWQGGPVLHPGIRFPFRPFLRLAGLRWRYSFLPPHGTNSRIVLVCRYWKIIQSIWCENEVFQVVEGCGLCLFHACTSWLSIAQSVIEIG
jgi:hypothetical protein